MATANSEPAVSLPDNLKPLLTEITTFLRELPRLIAEGEGGRFGVIYRDQVVGTWDTYRDALQYGRERFGEDQFIVQRIDQRDMARWAQFLSARGTEYQS